MDRVLEIVARIREAAREALEDGQLAHAAMLEGIAARIEAEAVEVKAAGVLSRAVWG